MLSDRCTVCPVCLSLTLVYCGQTVEWIKMLLGTEVGLGPGDIVLDGDPDSPKRGHNSPRFSVHVCGGQTARRIKRPLGTEVGLSPGHIVLGPSSPRPERGAASPPLFGPCFLWPYHTSAHPYQLLLTAELLLHTVYYGPTPEIETA